MDDETMKAEINAGVSGAIADLMAGKKLPTREQSIELLGQLGKSAELTWEMAQALKVASDAIGRLQQEKNMLALEVKTLRDMLGNFEPGRN